MKLLSFFVLVAVVVASDRYGPSTEPFDVTDQITVSEVLRRYPYLRPNMNPDVMYQKVMELPLDLKRRLHMTTLNIKDGRGDYHCYNPCVRTDLLKTFLENRYWSHNIGDLWAVIYQRDELHFRTINEFIQGMGVTDKEEHNRLLEKYMMAIVELPAFIYSVDLDKPMERNKFLIPNHFVTMSKPWNPFQRWEIDRDKARSASARYPWGQKQAKIFWRGGDSGFTYEYVGGMTEIFKNLPAYFPRMELVWQSHLHPDKIDAMFSVIDKSRVNNIIDYGMPEKTSLSFVDVADHIKYKYLISIDGWTAAWLRPNWIMASNSLLLKQQSRRVEWFSYLLKPHVHYYPVANDCSGLVEAIDYLESHEEQVQKMITAANKFVDEHWTPNQMTDDICALFRNYSRVQTEERNKVIEKEKAQKLLLEEEAERQTKGNEAASSITRETP